MTLHESPEEFEFGPFRLLKASRRLMCRNVEVSIGGRAMDVLLALASKGGQLVTKRELFEAAWPRSVVHDSNLKVTVAGLRQALREFSPEGDHIRTVVGRGYWLDDGKPGSRSAIITRVASGHRASLPNRPNLVGRDKVIEDVRSLLSIKRLTTIFGSGGIGKTAVAIAAAHLYAEEAGNSVTYVDLSSITTEEYVYTALGSAFGLSVIDRELLDAVCSDLAQRRTLLLLDTCEHVCDEVTHICNVLLAKAPETTILATSRKVLGAREESVFRLEPLEVPPPEHARTAESILRYPAAQMFAEKLLEHSGLKFENADALAIAEICRRLDGVPHAIDLAAPPVGFSGAQTFLRQLDSGIQSLRREVPEGPRRHQSLQQSFDWSYALLTNREALILRAMSIFVAPFDMDAVVHVLEHRKLDPEELFDAVAGLRSKSVLSIVKLRRQIRYRLVDTTRLFAADLLKNHGEHDAIAAGHAQFQLEVQSRACKEHVEASSAQGQETYAMQIHDLRKAVDWALWQGGDLVLGMRLVAAGLSLWRELSLEDEAKQNSGAALRAFCETNCADTALRLRLEMGVQLAAPRPTVGRACIGSTCAEETSTAHGQ